MACVQACINIFKGGNNQNGWFFLMLHYCLVLEIYLLVKKKKVDFAMLDNLPPDERTQSLFQDLSDETSSDSAVSLTSS